MADLSSAISRLEQVTERLVKFEASLGQSGLPAPTVSADKAATYAARPAVSTSTTNTSSLAATPAGSGNEVAAYDALLSEQLQPFINHAAALGGEVLDASRLVEKAFKEQRTVLLVAAKAKQPDMAQLQSVLQPVAEPMMAAAALAENRRSPCFQHLKVVAESLQGLTWLTYTGPSCGMHAPAQLISEHWISAEFYANKLLREFRGVNEAQVAWITALKDLFTALQQFVRTNCPNGLKWNPNGCTSIAAALADVAAAGPAPAAAATPAAATAAAAAAARGPKAPPAAPPPPPPGLLLQERPAKGGSSNDGTAAAAANGTAGGGMQDVLKALQQGSAVTAGLRKVTDDMKTKNRADRSGQVSLPAKSTGGAATTTPAPAAAPIRPPRIELEQERKWVVENHVNQSQLIITVTDPRQSVYIYNCKSSVVQVKGKCNVVSIDKCQKTGVVFEDIIASCELVNCSSVQVQCTGSVPTVSIDKCDGVQAYVPAALAANPNFQVVTAKSSEVNLLVVAADPEAEEAVAEHAVPEQFISTFVDGKLVTTAASHGGG